jgi:hypothetical protein
MKKHLLIFPFAAFALFSCGGGTTQQTQQSAFEYTEPNEDIAKIIFDQLATEDCDYNIFGVKNAISANYDTTSKTFIKLSCNDWSRLDDILFNGLVNIKCYQTKQNEWLGIVTNSIDQSMEGDNSTVRDIYTVLYSGGKVSRIDSTKVFPQEMMRIIKLFSNNTMVEWNFENTFFEVFSDKFSTIKFNWDGEKFVSDSQTPFITNIDPFREGSLKIEDSFDIDFNNEPDPKYNIKSDGIVKATDGTPLVKLTTLDNGKMIGYTILSKNICVNKNQNHDANAVAIGLPIKNVFPQYNDTTISKTTKDGKFVVTQLIKHDTENIFDIYYEYTAKDENSPIESISVTSKPFTTSIADELDKWGALLPETKKTILAFNLTEKLPELGTFQSLSGMGRQITLHFDSGDYYFQTYKSDNDTEYIMLIKFDYSNGADPESAKWWLHHGDKFTSIELPLPKRPYNDANYQLHIGDDGISYDNMEEKDFRSYPWNGNYFDNDYDDEENNTTSNGNITYSQFATGDLNGDNLKDSVAYDDGLSVFWGTDNGQYKLFKKYKVLKPEEGTYNKSAEIKDGNLVLKTRYQYEGFMNYDYTLHFQNGDFELIKYVDNSGLDYESIGSYDFNAKKGETEGYDEDGDYKTTFSLKNLPLKKLSDITIGDNIDVYDYIDEKTRKNVK